MEGSEAVMGAVLAGGHSRRMGEPKAMMPLGGRTLLDHAAGALAAAGLEVAIVAPAGAPLPEHGAPVWREPSAGARHPARGVLEALRRAGGPVVVLAVDLPLVAPSLLRALAAADGTVLPEAGGRLQPLVARWAPEAAPALVRAVADGTPLHAAATAAGATVLRAPELTRHGDPARMFTNVNRPEDLARAEALLGG